MRIGVCEISKLNVGVFDSDELTCVSEGFFYPVAIVYIFVFGLLRLKHIFSLPWVNLRWSFRMMVRAYVSILIAVMSPGSWRRKMSFFHTYAVILL